MEWKENKCCEMNAAHLLLHGNIDSFFWIVPYLFDVLLSSLFSKKAWLIKSFSCVLAVLTIVVTRNFCCWYFCVFDKSKIDKSDLSSSHFKIFVDFYKKNKHLCMRQYWMSSLVNLWPWKFFSRQWAFSVCV